eukprot:m.188876 g.188876  ORF g.188876 m.188876 type:complete len:84 (+) comp39396_c0_seq2:2616-2867(+)
MAGDRHAVVALCLGIEYLDGQEVVAFYFRRMAKAADGLRSGESVDFLNEEVGLVMVPLAIQIYRLRLYLPLVVSYMDPLIGYP